MDTRSRLFLDFWWIVRRSQSAAPSLSSKTSTRPLCRSCSSKPAAGIHSARPGAQQLRAPQQSSCSANSAATGSARYRAHGNRRHASTNGRSSGAGDAHAHADPLARIKTLHRKRNQTTMNYTIAAVLGTVALSYGSVPMYKMICQQMGWGGQPIRHTDPSSSSSSSSDSRLTPVTDAPRIRITFSSSVSSQLPWRFVPQQREVRVLPGETALAFYTAENRSGSDIIGVATYSVSPGGVAQYFSKIQCFCFEEQRLNAGEKVDMPVFFYIDPDFLKDPEMRNVRDVVLNYTFFKAKYDDNGVLTTVPLAFQPGGGKLAAGTV